MLDLDLIRRDPELVQQALKNRGEESVLEYPIELDIQRRQLIHQANELRAYRNQTSQKIAGDHERPTNAAKEMRLVAQQIKALEVKINDIESNISTILLTLPNIPLGDVPIGPDGSCNIEIRSWGEARSYDFEPKAHWDLNEHINIIDFERAVKISGSRFYILKNAGARLQRALITWMLDLHTSKHGYTEIYAPSLVRQETMLGSGNLPKFTENLYHDQEDDLWLIPTAEVPLTSLHRNEIIDPGTLPLSYVAYSPCFRREKASAGRETRGIKRVHQFDKVELYKLTQPENSDHELTILLDNAEQILRQLNLPYRVIQLCTGDLGFPSAKSYDLEVWAPGCQEWLEVSSCSNCTDFQARRSNIRFRREPRGRPELVHTLNGSGLAIPRVMIAILETYQTEDNNVTVPDVLREYMGMSVIQP